MKLFNTEYLVKIWANLTGPERNQLLELLSEETKVQLSTFIVGTDDSKGQEQSVIRKTEGELNTISQKEFPKVLCGLFAINSEVSSVKEFITYLVHLSEKFYYRQQYELLPTLLEYSLPIAEENEWFDLANKIYYLQIQVFSLLKSPSLGDLFLKRSRISDAHGNLNQYMAVLDRINSVVTKYTLVTGAKEVSTFKQLLTLPIMESEKLCLSKRGKRIYYLVKAMLHFHLEEHSLSKDFYGKFINYTMEHSFLLKEDLKFFIYTYFNYLTLLILTKEEDLAQEELANFNQLPERYPKLIGESLKDDIAIKSFIQKTTISIGKKDYINAVKLIPKFQLLADKPSNLVSPTTYLSAFALSAIVLLFNSNYNEARKWLRKIANDKSIGTAEDIRALGQLLSMLIAAEQKDYARLTNKLNETKKFFNFHKRTSRYEFMFLEMLIEINDNPKNTKIYTNYYRLFKSILDKPSEKNVRIYFDILEWLKMKMKQMDQIPKRDS